MENGTGYLVQTPPLTSEQNCMPFLEGSCALWDLPEHPVLVPVFRKLCFADEGDKYVQYKNNSIALLDMAKTKAACVHTCRTFACGNAYIAPSDFMRSCLWAQALYIAAVKALPESSDQDSGSCIPVQDQLPLINCGSMQSIVEDICPRAELLPCVEEGGLQIDNVYFDKSLLLQILHMSTVVSILLGLLVAQACIILVTYAIHRRSAGKPPGQSGVHEKLIAAARE